MDLLEIILLISAGQGLLLSLALISSGVIGKKQNLFLGLITLIISLEILTGWAVKTNTTNVENVFPFWIFCSYLALPPALFLFGKLSTKARFKIKFWHLALFFPAIIEIVVELSSFYSNRYLTTSYSLINNPAWFWFTEILPLLVMILALAVVGKDIQKLRSSIQFLPGKKAQKHLVKVFVFFICFLLITLLWFLEAIIHLPVFKYTVIILCIIIFALGYISFFNPDFFSLPPLLTRKTSFSDNARESRTEAERIHKMFIKKKLYHQPQLTVKKAATELDISPRHLSEMINTYHGMDFRNYVNTLRINDVIKKIENGELDKKTLLGLAMDSGFSSKSTFNQAFKDIKGNSPTNYFNPNKSN
ncbi:helix-turn-helix domain-containing protein [Mangrovivirga cuniculi]|uniref:HTH araC/xylS-type domain-containing protein n=1 Tax=Mangrovivirga cuniculi TaxID=2715131 RepID=A0A4D7JP76_9BACT|nr:helix-turn-helix domain-containing protein [Mangrovivirga cuniculi]QCK14602.1 hypothetical protein DCC35_07520 [Mangrovivirga cuniculi]